MKVGLLLLEGSQGKGGGRCKYCFRCITLQFLRGQSQFVSNPVDAEISESKNMYIPVASTLWAHSVKTTWLPNCVRHDYFKLCNLINSNYTYKKLRMLIHLLFLYLFKDWFISALERQVAFTRIPLRERAFWFAPMDKQKKWSVPIRCNLTLKKKFAIYRIKHLKIKKW